MAGVELLISSLLQRRWFIWFIVTATFLMLMFIDGASGSTVRCINGDCRVEAALNPVVFVPSILLIGLIFALGALPVLPTERGEVRKRHIVFAAMLDIFIILLAIAPFAAAVPLIIESLHLQRGVLEFERDYLRPSDWHSIMTVFAGLWVFGAYLGRPASGPRITLGQYLLRFQVSVDPELPAWQRWLGVIFHPLLLIVRPLEQRIGIHRPPLFAFTAIKARRIE